MGPRSPPRASGPEQQITIVDRDPMKVLRRGRARLWFCAAKIARQLRSPAAAETRPPRGLGAKTGAAPLFSLEMRGSLRPITSRLEQPTVLRLVQGARNRGARHTGAELGIRHEERGVDVRR